MPSPTRANVDVFSHANRAARAAKRTRQVGAGLPGIASLDRATVLTRSRCLEEA